MSYCYCCYYYYSSSSSSSSNLSLYLSLSQLWKSCKKQRGVWNMNPKNQTEELSLDLWELRFSTTVDRNLRYPIQQKAARTCYWNLWPQHSTKERERQEREKNLDFFSSFCRINGLNKNNSNNPLTTELDTAQSSDLYSKMWLKLLCLRIFPAYKSKQRKNEEEEKWTEQNRTKWTAIESLKEKGFGEINGKEKNQESKQFQWWGIDSLLKLLWRNRREKEKWKTERKKNNEYKKNEWPANYADTLWSSYILLD